MRVQQHSKLLVLLFYPPYLFMVLFDIVEVQGEGVMVLEGMEGL